MDENTTSSPKIKYEPNPILNCPETLKLHKSSLALVVPLLLSSKSSVFQVESQTQIGPPPNYLENDFETTLTERNRSQL